MFVTSKIRALLPRVVTRREIIRGVPGRWKGSYADDSMKLARGETAGSIRAALEALDVETASAADVAAIIGNDSWTALKCDVCEEDREVLVSVPREYGESVSVCGPCAEGVLEMLAALSPTPQPSEEERR